MQSTVEPLDCYTKLPLLSLIALPPVEDVGFYLYAGADYRIELPFTFTICDSKQRSRTVVERGGDLETRHAVYGPLKLSTKDRAQRTLHWTEDLHLVALLHAEPSQPVTFAALQVKPLRREYWSLVVRDAQFSKVAAVDIVNVLDRRRAGYNKRALTSAQVAQIAAALPGIQDKWRERVDGPPGALPV